MLQQSVSTINSFLEDTCVIAVVAWLLTRGNLLRIINANTPPWNHVLGLGTLFGVLGLTEVLLPDARYPYRMDSLVISFASSSIGHGVGLTATLLIGLVSLITSPSLPSSITFLGLLLCFLTAAIIRKSGLLPNSLLRGILCGTLGQTMMIVLYVLELESKSQKPGFIQHWIWSIPANGFGVALLLVIRRDAELREASSVYRLEAEHALTLASEAQLNALRARVHPHFLFNALTTIAGLCRVSADLAVDATVRLGKIMRRYLETDLTKGVPLKLELEHTMDYLDLEKERMGGRIEVTVELESTITNVIVPSFSLMTIVENAIVHGLSKSPGSGSLRIYCRRFNRSLLVFIIDTGVGMTKLQRIALFQPGDRIHGLQILDEQLRLQYGNNSRIRIFSKPDEGTIVAFKLPMR